MVNLISQKNRRALNRRYYVSLATTLLLAVIAVVVVGGVLLIPSYFAARTSADSYERYRDALEGAVGLKEREYVSTSISALNERVRIMEDYAGSPFTADFVDTLGERLSSDIAVTALSFNRGEGGAAVAFSGTARTRESLLAFVESLRESPSFTDVTLPVSQLVVEENASFSIQAVYVAPE